LMASGPATIRAQSASQIANNNELDFDLNLKDQVTVGNGEMYIGSRPLPPLPKKLSPGQAARVAEILDFLHRGLSFAAESMRANDEANEVRLSFAEWQKILAVQMLLARYLRAVS